MGLSGAIPFVSSRGLRVLCEAVQFRVFGVTGASVRTGVFSRAFGLRSAFFRSFLGREAEPMRVWDWILSMPSRRRKELIRVFKAYEARGFEPSKRYGEIKAFVKTEKLPFFATNAQGDEYSSEHCEYVARLIQAPHDETHLDAGRYLKPLVGRLKDDWSYDNWLFYASVNPTKLDKWLNRHKSAASWFWADYSSFDATYTPEAWSLIEALYAQVYPDAEPEFWRALEAWRSPHGSILLRKDDAWVKYTAPVCNASGRDDTALANALFNGIALACSIAAAYFGVDLLDLEAKHIVAIRDIVAIAVVGDDSLVALSVDVDPLKPMVLRNLQSFGLKVKAETSHDLVDVTFLASMPYPVGDQFFWGPTLGRRLYKAFWQEQPVGNLPAWTLGVAKQLMLYRHVPLLYDIAMRIVALLPGGKVTDFQFDPNRPWDGRDSATTIYGQETIEWLARRYASKGLTAGQIRSDIASVQGISRLPVMCRFYTTEAALLLDDL